MNVGTNGIVVDQHGNVLLIKRNDTRTFAPPGGALDPGELPPDGAAREVREETGLIVLPVRLATLTYLPLAPSGFLSFTFRCLLRGGEITPSAESPVVGFFKTTPLPRRIASFHRERLQESLSHAAERPLFFQHRVSNFNKAARFVLRHFVYRWLDVKRRLQGQPPFQPPPTWEVATYFLYRNAAGAYLWHRPHDTTPWQLPGGTTSALTAPWETAWQLPGGTTSALTAPWETAVQLAWQQTGIHLRPRELTDVYLGPGKTRLNLVFTAEAVNNPPQNNTALAWFSPNGKPAHQHPQHYQMAANGTTKKQPTQFHMLDK